MFGLGVREFLLIALVAVPVVQPAWLARLAARWRFPRLPPWADARDCRTQAREPASPPDRESRADLLAVATVTLAALLVTAALWSAR